MERFAGGNPGHLPSEPGAAQGTHRGGVKGIGYGQHHQDLDGLELSRRDRRRHRRWLHQPRLHESKTSNLLSNFLLLSQNYESLGHEIDPAEPEEDTDSVK